VQPPSTVVAYRTATDIDDANSEMPNNSLAGLGLINEKLNAIKDPRERELTEQGLEIHFAAHRNAIDVRRKDIINQQVKNIQSDKTYDPLTMPLEMQMEIRPSDMAMLIDLAASRAPSKTIKTNQTEFYNVQDIFATNPEEFYTIDLNRYRLVFSDQDFQILEKKQELFRTDPQKAMQQARELKRAFELAMFELEGTKRYYQPHGVTLGQDGKLEDKKFANFQSDLAREIETFRDQNKDGILSDADVRRMIGNLIFKHYIDKTPKKFTKTAPQNNTQLR
jgi:hypothetical protein